MLALPNKIYLLLSWKILRVVFVSEVYKGKDNKPLSIHEKDFISEEERKFF